MFLKKKNSEELKEVTDLEDRLSDKEKIIKLYEEKIAHLEELFSIKKTYSEIKKMQNEIIENLEKRKGKIKK